MHENVIFIHVYACFLCLNLKLGELPEENETIFALQKNVLETILALQQNVFETI